MQLSCWETPKTPVPQTLLGGLHRIQSRSIQLENSRTMECFSNSLFPWQSLHRRKHTSMCFLLFLRELVCEMLGRKASALKGCRSKYKGISNMTVPKGHCWPSPSQAQRCPWLSWHRCQLTLLGQTLRKGEQQSLLSAFSSLQPQPCPGP